MKEEIEFYVFLQLLCNLSIPLTFSSEQPNVLLVLLTRLVSLFFAELKKQETVNRLYWMSSEVLPSLLALKRMNISIGSSLTSCILVSRLICKDT